jgi:hypothetical protein
MLRPVLASKHFQNYIGQDTLNNAVIDVAMKP